MWVVVKWIFIITGMLFWFIVCGCIASYITSRFIAWREKRLFEEAMRIDRWVE